MRFVRDDPEHPDAGFAELYASLPDATDLEPWLGWCRAAAGPVLYLGVGAGRLAVPLAGAGVDLVGVDAHPGMLARLRVRLPGIELVQARIEDLRLERRFDLVLGPSGVLGTPERLAAARSHASPGGRVALELVNPHWLLASGHAGVRVLRTAGGLAEVEVDYPGGWTQRAEVRLWWPEEGRCRTGERSCGADQLPEVRQRGPAAPPPAAWYPAKAWALTRSPHDSARSSSSSGTRRC